MSILSFCAIVSSLLVVTATNTILSIIWLVAVFILTALILSILGISYAALTYILVYVGAIAILFLFVVQLLDQRNLNLTMQQNMHKIDTDFSVSRVNSSDTLNGILHSPLKSGQIKTTVAGSMTNSFPLILCFGLLFFFLLPFKVSLFSGVNSSFFKTGLDVFSSTSLNFSYIFNNVSKNITSENIKFLSLEPIEATSSTYSIFNIEMANLEETHLNHINQIINLGEWLYGSASISLLIISIILLLAMVGPIVLCWRKL